MKLNRSYYGIYSSSSKRPVNSNVSSKDFKRYTSMVNIMRLLRLEVANPRPENHHRLYHSVTYFMSFFYSRSNINCVSHKVSILSTD